MNANGAKAVRAASRGDVALVGLSSLANERYQVTAAVILEQALPNLPLFGCGSALWGPSC